MAGRELEFWSFVAVQAVVAPLIVGLIVYWPAPWDAQRIAGAVLALVGMALLVVARYQLGKSFSVTPQARALVTHGIYSRIRNPIYVFSAVMIVGLILVLHRPKMWIFLAVLVPIQMLRARQEARVLEQKFGEEYREYRRKTWF